MLLTTAFSITRTQFVVIRRAHNYIMKILFITHDIGIYGAARSLSLHIKSLLTNDIVKKEDIFLLYAKPFLKFTSIKPEMLKGLNYKKSILLPSSRIHKGHEKSLYNTFKYMVKNIVSIIYCFFYLRLLLKHLKPDLIHLNSLTIWPLLFILPKKYKTIIHIREIYNENVNIMTKKLLRKALLRAYKIIGIDEGVKKALRGIAKDVEVLRNPFDMENARMLRETDRKTLYERINLSPELKTVALIGRIQPIKGQSFFIDLAEAYYDKENTLFLVIGTSGNSNYYSLVSEKAKKCANLRILGGFDEMDVIFPILDVIVRCEDFLPLGRTVFEGYYAGCSVLLPVKEEDDITEIRQFLNDGIWLYKARNITDISEKLKLILDSNNSFRNRPSGNLKRYSQEFMKILGIYGVTTKKQREGQDEHNDITKNQARGLTG